MQNYLAEKQALIEDLDSIVSCKLDRLVRPYAWAGHIPFAMFIVKQLKPRLLVELGTHSGNSFNAFCQSVKLHQLNTTCVAVDCWDGDVQAGFYGEDIFRDLAAYQKANYKDIAELKRMYFSEAVESFTDGSIDLLHIDGLHTYEAVKEDFETWLPKMSNQGVILFHDTQVFERNFGVNKLWLELTHKYPSFEFTHNHGLGVLLVGSEPVSEVSDLVQFAINNKTWVQQQFYAAACVMLPIDAKAYMMKLQLDADTEDLDKIIVAELFESTTTSFSEKAKQFQYQTWPKDSGVTIFELTFDVNSGTKFVRLDPCHDAVLISENLTAEAYTPYGKEELVLISANYLEKVERRMLFPTDPQLIFSLPNGAQKVSFKYECHALDGGLNQLFVRRYRELILDNSNLISENQESKKDILALIEDNSAKEMVFLKLHNEMDELVSKYKEKEQHIVDLQLSLEGKTEEYQTLRKQTDELIAKYKEKEQHIADLQLSLEGETDEHQTLRKQTDELIAKYKEKEQHIADLQLSLEGKTDEYQTLRKQTDELTTKYREKEKHVADLQLSLEGKTEEYQTLRKQTDELITKYKEKEQHIADLQLSLEGKTEEHQTLRKQTDELIAKYKEKEQHIADLQLHIESKTAEYLKLRSANEVLSIEFNELCEERKKFELESKRNSKEVQSLRKSIQEYEKSFGIKITRLFTRLPVKRDI